MKQVISTAEVQALKKEGFTKCDNTCFLALHEMGDPRVARGVFASLSQKGLTFTWDNSSNGDPRFNTLYGLTDDGIDVYFNLIKGKGE